MKTSISIATFLLAGAGAAGAGAAVPSPFQGSDTLFNVTRDAIAAIAVNDPSIGPPTSYVGGGSGNGQSAMVSNTQQHIAPMSRMMNSGNALCSFNGGTNGSKASDATGLIIGLDAVDVLASTTALAGTGSDSQTCNAGDGGATPGDGLAYDGLRGNGQGFANYKEVLALVYGGLDLTVGTCSVGGASCAHVGSACNTTGSCSPLAADCGSAKRTTVVNTWGNLFENACANGEAVCGDATHGGKLWHAFRRDDASGTADVFASVLGLSPSTSASSNNGFGASPYCNAMNWDVSAANKSPVCGLGAAKQFTGPGGVLEGMCSVTTTMRCSAVGATSVCGHVVQSLSGTGSVADGNGRVCDTTACGSGGTCTPQCPTGETCVALDGTHRKPPPGTWGEQPDPGQNTRAFSDVLPTSYQDNDPIRRPCIRNGHNTTTGGDDVCNMDGTLGLVLPIPASDFMVGLSLRQYPDTISSDARTKFDVGTGVSLLNCAPFLSSKHSGECPNGDVTNLGNCQTPLTATSSQCYTVKADLPLAKTRQYLGINDGRIFNVHMRNGSTTAPIPYAHETIPTASGGTLACGDGSSCSPAGSSCADGSTCGLRFVLDFGGNYSRIHAASTVPTGQTACQLKDATDQIGCLTQADHCSIGYGGDGANTWGQRNPGGVVASNISSILVNQVAPAVSTVTALGNGPVEYPLSRKLYLNSIVGFGSASLTASELEFAQFEANPGSGSTNIDTILVNDGFFSLGAFSLTTPDTPFCEDFNQALICGAASNDNACFRNPAGMPNDLSADPTMAQRSTVCGNGIVELFEECDPTADPSTWTCSVPGATICSSTCRC